MCVINNGPKMRGKQGLAAWFPLVHRSDPSYDGALLPYLSVRDGQSTRAEVCWRPTDVGGGPTDMSCGSTLRATGEHSMYVIHVILQPVICMVHTCRCGNPATTRVELLLALTFRVSKEAKGALVFAGHARSLRTAWVELPCAPN